MAIRLAPNASKASKAADMGLVALADGRAARMHSVTRSSPRTIEAEVQPKATTSSSLPGRIRSTVSVRRGPIAASVSGVTCGELRMRAS